LLRCYLQHLNHISASLLLLLFLLPLLPLAQQYTPYDKVYKRLLLLPLLLYYRKCFNLLLSQP
jgi:hypothetical protein